MHLIINGYEFGQWLRILLWIGLPGMVLLTMLATWVHYRRGRVAAELLLLQMGGLDEGGAFAEEHVPEAFSQDERVDLERSVKEGEDDYKENLYKGILWMKEKYEQYRDLADERYGQLKDQLARMEKKYEELLTRVRSVHPELLEAGTTKQAVAVERVEPVEDPGLAAMTRETQWTGSAALAEELPAERGPLDFSGETEILVERVEAGGERAETADRMRIQELEEQLARTEQRFDEEIARLRHQLDDEIARGRRLYDEKNAGVDAGRLLEQQVLHLSRQLEEKQRMIADMEGQQATDRLKIDELVAKLRNNSTLLMNIYQELDKSLHLNEGPPRE